MRADGTKQEGSMSAIPWAGPDSPLSQFIANDFENRLIAYQAKPDDITEHAKIEAQVNEGGYAERQLLELVQNARDSIYRDWVTAASPWF